MSTGLHNFALPPLKWARTKLSDPSAQPESNDPNQEPTQQEQLANAVAVEAEADESSGKTWNLRPRKPVSSQPPLYQSNEAVNLDNRILRNERREKKKEKFCISLTKEEIEEDLYSMTGMLPTRRPKRRTRAVQKLVDNVLPGSCFDGKSADMYRAERFP
ncbi:hypothetical protein POM88_033350 [Heracleum sosnowskyi]|uniref:Uncharacterized protein n=1 Tax=Heracleum sosnowskyi TaxID=360622 RepID=A0AAD8I343_9APIA|nr:hypothetical protein POM88_033350 [Heracleum sosnowskyi]